MKIKNRILSFVASKHPMNNEGGRDEYPQLWYCMPQNTKATKVLQWICGITGHELSAIEWGYGGGDYADRWCRWCNKRISVPKTSVQFQFPGSRERMRGVGINEDNI